MDPLTARTPVLRLAGAPLPVVGRARMYVCGITPYATTHVGHAATFVWADVAARVLRHLGVEVDVCRNVTDVDDDMLAEAARTGLPYRTLAARQSFLFAGDMARLRVERPAYEPASHTYIEEVVALAAGLLARGAAYVADGSVYFRGAGVPERAGLTAASALALAAAHGGRVDDPAKHDPLDVAVWQASGPDEPSWLSPWGPGRPGWHAECAAMAMAHFGPTVDIHAGGADLAFPHHAYEAAQAEALTGVSPFARAWLRAGTVTINGAKMAKSTGNLVLVSELVRDHPPEALRLLILSRPAEQGWEFRADELTAAESRLEVLYSRAGQLHASLTAQEAVQRRLADGLDTLGALAVAEEAGGAAARLAGRLLGLL